MAIGPFGSQGADGGNPFVSGLVNAVNIAAALQGMNNQRQRLALDQARESREAQFQQDQKEHQDLQTRLQLQQDGARKVDDSGYIQNPNIVDNEGGPSQGGEGGANPNYRPDQYKSAFTPPELPEVAPIGGQGQGLPQTTTQASGRVKADPSRTAMFRGQRYQIADDTERDVRAATVAKNKASQEADAEGQKEYAKKHAEAKAMHEELEQNGVRISDEAADLMGWPRGTKVLPQHLDDVARAVSVARVYQDRKDMAAGKTYAGVSYDKQGRGTIFFTDGSSEPLAGGRPIGKPQQTPGNTPANARNAANDATKKQLEQVASEALLGAKNGDEAEKALRRKALTDPFTRQNFRALRGMVNPKKSAAEINAQTARDFLGANSDDGGDDDESDDTAAAPAPAAAAAPAAKKQAMTPAEFIRKHQDGK